MVYSPAAFPILKRRDKTRVLQGETLSIDSMELAVGESESIFRYYDSDQSSSSLQTL
jgi:hypothetical protein